MKKKIGFGISFLTYPTNENKDEIIKATNPVEDSLLLGGKEYKTHAVWPSECSAYDMNSKELSDYGIYLADVYC